MYTKGTEIYIRKEEKHLNKPTLGKRLKDIRLKLNLSQENVANHLYVTRQSISKWENDKSNPDLDTLKKLSVYYDIPINDLLNDPIEEIVALEKSDTNSKQEKDESLNLLIVTLLSFLIAPFGLIIIPVILKRRHKNVQAKLILIACIFSIFVNLFVIYSIVGDYAGFGTESIELIE